MFTTELLLKVIPQRYPFMMIDRILEHSFRQKAVCRKNVTFGEEVLTGHFPGKPIYPGVLLVEMGMQTTQVMLTDLEKVISGGGLQGGAEQGFLISIEKFKFQRTVSPGDVLKVTSEFHQETMGMYKAKITIENQEGEPVAQGMVIAGGASR